MRPIKEDGKAKEGVSEWGLSRNYFPVGRHLAAVAVFTPLALAAL